MLNPCELVSEASNCIRGILGCLCCLVIGGPIMFIVGIVVLSADNHRAEDVAAFNAAVASFDTTGMSLWSAGGTMGGSPFSMQQDLIVVSGNQEGINSSAFSYYGANSVSSWTTLTFAANTATPFTRNSVRSSITVSGSVRCSTSSSQCSAGTMASLCQSQYGSTATYAGGACDDGDSCGSCTLVKYLSEYCAVMRRSSAVLWVESTSYRSCLYPFSVDSQVYAAGASAPSTVTLKLYSEDDPLLVLEAKTKGTRDFGLTADQQRTIGITLIVIGALLTTAVIVALVAILRIMKNSENTVHPAPGEQGAPEAAQGMPVTNQLAQQPPHGYVEIQSGYGQPQFGYHEPQPGYGQPPNYGQPPFGYGDPPQPAFGQPHVVYAKPQSLY